MNTIELIRKKREAKSLSTEEIEYMIENFVTRKIPDYQFASFLMASFINGLNKKETSALTKSMLYSGKVLDLSEIPGIKVDKHSTGGVGDKTSLIIAPIVAAAGVPVPMISGRGLGHSGGTLDKLEAIPGFKTNLNLKQYKSVLKNCGAVLIGQTKEIAPADKIIYSLRDVTATVESIPLITASIMSKKLAEGIDGLVLDVKTGNGAFMKTLNDSKSLAQSLIDTALSFNKKVIAFITDMNQPLGNYIGNWFEVLESIQVLQGEKVDDLLEVSLNLSGAMIYLGKKAGSIKEGIDISKELIKNGKAFDKFLEISRLQNGEEQYLRDPSLYPQSQYVVDITADESGYISSYDTYQIGMISLELGAGRLTKNDIIDPKAGIIINKKIGDKVKKGDSIAQLFTDKENAIEKAINDYGASIGISKKATKKPKLIKTVIHG
ncbi:MAG: thymidine phosphorylase [Ignavibacteriaceae bacterium]|jgi:pyrimidine-nucleoside phosphorylase|nr:thymidine phosphorylase [Ignavibacteriaceae bacterium]